MCVYLRVQCVMHGLVQLMDVRSRNTTGACGACYNFVQISCSPEVVSGGLLTELIEYAMGLISTWL